jgi:hypothetical protein
MASSGFLFNYTQFNFAMELFLGLIPSIHIDSIVELMETWLDYSSPMVVHCIILLIP